MLLAGIAACSPGKGVEVSILSDRSVQAIQGEWTHCETNAIEAKDISTSYTVNGPTTGELIVVHASSNGTCTGAARMTILRGMTMTEGRDTNPLSGTEALDFYYIDGEVTANHASYQAKVALLTGVASPTLGTYYSIEDYDAWTSIDLPADGDVIYTRQQVVTSTTPDTLYFGEPEDASVDDGSDDGKRHKALSADVFYKVD